MNVNSTIKSSFEECTKKKRDGHEGGGEEKYLSFELKPVSSRFSVVVVTVESTLANVAYDQTIELFKRRKFSGFEKKNIPQEYVEENFRGEIQKKVKNYLFKYKVIKYLFDQLIEQKVHFSNYPRLKKIEITPDRQIRYSFNISLIEPLELKEWKHFSFKAPKRKKYKDLDKQVISFISEKAIPERKQKMDEVEENDWVCFDAMLLDRSNQPLKKKITGTFWMRVRKSEVIDPLQELFFGRHLNESFPTDSLDVKEESFNNFDNYYYNFLVSIKSIVKGTHMSLDNLKNMFKLKNKTEIHNKLMEVFSYRDDLSQRKATIEELFHLFLSKHRFEIPKHLIMRRQEDILLSVMEQPDYQVYRSQRDFEENVALLAEKQIKEEIIIDKIAYQENVKVDSKDIQHYLHLFNNKRLREFVYFKPVIQRIDSVNTPLNQSVLKQTVLREKTLNTVIHTLTR